MRAEMPVDERTVQPMGILHGGASVALAESLASIGALLWIDPATQVAVGQEINANHIRPVSSGKVFGTAKPIHSGRGSQVWTIEIKNAEGKLISVSRCTISIVPKRL
ncbi:UNVERIFIED_CONTAM: hypothetical protein GTU68_019997 [Idotea baltica]|nr:hypothetical protein [Idotea baltica]